MVKKKKDESKNALSVDQIPVPPKTCFIAINKNNKKY